ncbi:MAG: flagellar motor protein MotB [Verrucomicrobia bacterium]|nr:flagellar motor protein MotB [Verrucomicrobiota bacterium]
MNLSSLKLSLVAASAMLVLAGCTKKPDRPHPGSTVIGPQTGGPGLTTPPIDTTFGQTTGLVERGSEFDPNGHNRTALQAQTVLFDFDKSDIKASEREKLKAAKEYLEKNPTFRLLLEGHCDWRGTAEYNLGLGDRRAAATRKHLQSLGVAAERLETLSKGSLEAAKNADEATMAKDRRVDLIVVNPAAAAPKPL